MMGIFAYMPNLTAIPSFNCPICTVFQSICEGDGNIHDISQFVFKEHCNYDQAFAYTGITSVSFSQTFKPDSSYKKTFFGCTSLTGMSDYANQSSWTIYGQNHADCFNGCTKFAMQSYYTDGSYRFRFRESKSISGFLRNTDAITAGSSTRTLKIDAPYVDSANYFLDSSRGDLVDKRTFYIVTADLPICNHAQSLFGPMKITARAELRYNPTDDPLLIETVLDGCVIISNETEIEITASDINMRRPGFGRALIEALNTFAIGAGWHTMNIYANTFDVAIINRIQDHALAGSASRGIWFYNCTFENPSGITKLSMPRNYPLSISCNSCTNAEMLKSLGLTESSGRPIHVIQIN